MFRVGDRVWNNKHKCNGIITMVLDNGNSYVLSGKTLSISQQHIHQTADDMFKDLDFLITINDKEKLSYSNGVFAVIFDLIEKSYVFSTATNKAFYIDIPLHNAIHQKLIELGWIK